MLLFSVGGGGWSDITTNITTKFLIQALWLWYSPFRHCISISRKMIILIIFLLLVGVLMVQCSYTTARLTLRSWVWIQHIPVSVGFVSHARYPSTICLGQQQQVLLLLLLLPSSALPRSVDCSHNFSVETCSTDILLMYKHISQSTLVVMLFYETYRLKFLGQATVWFG